MCINKKELLIIKIMAQIGVHVKSHHESYKV